MTVRSFDTETSRFRPANKAPPLVCMTHSERTLSGGMSSGLVHHSDALPLFRKWLENGDTLPGANTAYDTAVLCAEFPRIVPAVFDHYGAPGSPSGFRCVKIRQQLLDIAAGQFRGKWVGRSKGQGQFLSHTYDLAAIARRHTAREMSKDTWRLLYGEFRDVPLDEWDLVAAPIRAREIAALEQERGALVLTNQAGRKRAEQIDKALEHWLAEGPEGCRRYPIEDAEVTLEVYEGQEAYARYLGDEHLQTRAQFWLHLVSTWGIRTDRRRVETLRASAEEAQNRISTRLSTFNVREFLWGRGDGHDAALALREGTLNTRGKSRRDSQEYMVRSDGTTCEAPAIALMQLAYLEKGRDLIQSLEAAGVSLEEAKARVPREITYRLTKTGRLALDGDACDQAALALVQSASTGVWSLRRHCTDPALNRKGEPEIWYPLADWATFATYRKILTNDVEALVRGTTYPIHTSFGMAATTRTTSSGPNIQNPRRLEGVREIYEPRPGMIYFDADYGQIEMCTLAQTCIKLFGRSPLADAINAGHDPHVLLAAQLLNISDEEAVRRHKATKGGVKDEIFGNARQAAKVGNFGVPGGLGAEKLALFAWKAYKVAITEARAREIIAATKTRWGLHQYFAYINSLCAQNENGEATFIHPVCPDGYHHVQGGATYTAACNSHFQRLAAALAKDAGFLILKAQYADRSNVLYGSRTVNFVHDQFIGECLDDSRAHDVAHELSRIMIDSARRWLPDVRVTAEPGLMRVWSKGAFALKGPEGRLHPWNGEKVDEATGQIVLARRDAEGYVVYGRESA